MIFLIIFSSDGKYNEIQFIFLLLLVTKGNELIQDKLRKIKGTILGAAKRAMFWMGKPKNRCKKDALAKR